jgi:hypothetical protein
LMVSLQMRSFPVMTPDRQLYALTGGCHARPKRDNSCPLATNLRILVG